MQGGDWKKGTAEAIPRGSTSSSSLSRAMRSPSLGLTELGGLAHAFVLSYVA